MKTYAIIPARKGSKGVPNKNIKNLGGHPLIAHSIAAAKLASGISRVIVSTDSEEYAKIAIKYGAEVPFIRPESISNDKSSDLEFFQHAISWFEANEKTLPDFFVHLRPTTPIRSPQHIDEAIKKILNYAEATSLRSSHESPESPYKWFKIVDDIYTTLDGSHDVERANGARQSFPAVYIPNGYVDIIRTKYVIDKNKLHGDKCLSYITEFCTEIDNQEEFEYLEYQVTSKESPIMKYLSGFKRD